jgi:hypothetical protein
VDQDAIRIQGYGNDELLERFPDGYFLYTLTRNRNSSREPLRIDVNQIGVKPVEFELTPTSGVDSPPREFVVQRFNDADRRQVRIQVADVEGAFIADARVELAPTSRRGNVSDESLSAVTDKEGQVEFSAFPMTYSLRVNADGFKAESEALDLRENARRESDRQIKLYRAIKASLRVAWNLTPAQQGGSATSGETTIPLGVGPPQFHDHLGIVQTIRPVQIKDQLMIQFTIMPYGGYPMPAPDATMWLRALNIDSVDGDRAVRKEVAAEFTSIDLKDVEKIKELKEVELGNLAMMNRAPGHVPAAPGTIYVGKLPHRDPRTGQFSELTFKVMVEQFSQETSQAEDESEPADSKKSEKDVASSDVADEKTGEPATP